MNVSRSDISILVVDDEPDITEYIRHFLDEAGYQTQVAHSHREMLDCLSGTTPHLVLLDLGLPDAEGIDVARDLGKTDDMGLIIISGRTSSVDRVVGLEIGADDYITKPFDDRELLARVRSVLRRIEQLRAARSGPTHEGSIARFGDWSLDLLSFELRRGDGRRVVLTTHEFNLLALLVRNANAVLSRDRILETLSGREWNPMDRSVDTLVSKVRQKIEADPHRPEIIKTVRGAGYRLSTPVTFLTGDTA